MATTPGRALHQAPKTYDEAKLVSMAEPLTVTIDRLKNNSRTPISIPDHDDGSPGSIGWSADEIRKINTWLVNDWAGGGLYEISVTDSTQPVPITMKWQPYWSPSEYPEKVPPTMREAHNGNIPLTPIPLAQRAQQQPQNYQQGARQMTAFPGGLPQGGYMQPQPQQQYAQPMQYAQPFYQQMPPPPPVNSPHYSSWTAERDRLKMEEELARLRESAHKAELDRVRSDAESKTKAAQSSTDAQISELRALVTSIVSAVKEKPAPTGPDPIVVELREANKRLEAKLEEEKRERDAEKRDQLIRDQIKTQADESRRSQEAMEKRFETLMLTITNQPKNDPVIELLKAQSVAHADTVKEMARSNKEVIDRIASTQMGPMQILDLVQRSSSAADQATDRLSRVYGTVIDTQQKVTENALQMQPQGSPVVDTIREGLNGLKDFADKYVSAQERNSRYAMGAQAQVATAQAAAQAAQFGVALNGMNGMNGMQQPQSSGPIVTVPPIPDPQLAAPTAVADPVVVTTKPKKAIERLWGRTDAEWFTEVALPEVIELRAGVAEFLESMQEISSTGKGEIKGTRPDQAAFGIIVAMNQAEQRQLSIPAMTDLLMKGQVAEFLNVLLPDANQVYREETRTQLDVLFDKLSRGEPLEQPPAEIDPDADEAPDDADDADGDADDAVEPENVEAQVVTPPTVNGTKATPIKPKTAPAPARRA